MHEQVTLPLAPVDPRVSGARAGQRNWFRLAALDFARPLPAALLTILFVVSRLPWLGLGYGADPDAWRVAMSARYLLSHGSYLPSRLPGYPVHDILMAALLWGGWWLTNFATLAVSLIGVFLFARIARRLASPVAGLLTATFAFLPMVWSTSSVTLDYMWALTFLLGAYLAVINRRPVLAGALLGLAGGCRISSLAFGLPFALVLWHEQVQHAGTIAQSLRPPGPRRREGHQMSRGSPDALGSASASASRVSPRRLWEMPAVRFTAAAGLTWLAVFAPIWIRFGVRFWNFYDVRPSWGDFGRALAEQTVGLLPLAVLILALACSWQRLRCLPELLRRDPHANAWAIAVLLALFIYVRLPLQVYYLLPAFPFGLLLLTRVLSQKWLLAVCAMLALGGFVDVYTGSAAGWRSPEALLRVRPMPGLVLQDYQLRHDRLQLVRHLAALDLPDKTLVSAGFYFPMVAEFYHSQLRLTLLPGSLAKVGPLTDLAVASPPGKDAGFVWLLEKGEARWFIQQGYTIYSLDSTREQQEPVLKRVYDTETDQLGVN